MMPSSKAKQLPVVDNSKGNTVTDVFTQWFETTKCLRIATGYFEVGSLLALDGSWQKIESIRILMGDDFSRRTRAELLAALKRQFDDSIEKWKESDDALTGLRAVREALLSGQIEFRIYTKAKFHAKCYLFESRFAGVVPTALVGSSNFTRPGITQNIELNYRVTVPAEVDFLSEWFEARWKEADKDIKPDLVNLVERQIEFYKPFSVYTKALHEYFLGKEKPTDHWEEHESRLFAPVLSRYQQDGYRQLMKIAAQYNGALLCDSVGLGKTYIGLMLIERLLRDRKRVCLLVPKSGYRSVWLPRIKKHLPDASGVFGGNLEVLTHSELLVERREEDWQQIKQRADVFIIDEAHQFRTIDSKRSRHLFDVTDPLQSGKLIFLLTATPVNNSLLDLYHLIRYFARDNDKFFAALGINSLRYHFVDIERRIRERLQISIDATDDGAQIQEEARDDRVLKAVVVQRSRAYVKESERIASRNHVLFPDRQLPQIVPYSLRKIYGSVLDRVEEAFSREEPLLYLRVYYPYLYYKGRKEDIDPLIEGRQKQVVSLIRTLLLKRFESSYHSFKLTCGRMLLRLVSFVKRFDPQHFGTWEKQHKSLLAELSVILPDISLEDADDDPWPGIDEPEKDIKPEQFDIPRILTDTIMDIGVLVELLNKMSSFTPQHDDKLNQLIALLKSDEKLSSQKVVIFTEFKDTARYLDHHLKAAGFTGVEEVDSDCDREDAILRFAPFYNGSAPDALAKQRKSEIRIVVSTDVLSEGLNLQDAFLLINYDLHWNPVRLMQRIGRVDRRMDPDTEEAILKAHPDQKPYRGKVWYWNFLPPSELNRILSLYKRVTHKVITISEMFGIETGRLLHPDDHLRALQLFNEAYEGAKSPEEAMRTCYERILKAHPGIEDQMRFLPKRLFSNKNAESGLPKGLFACYRFPSPQSLQPSLFEGAVLGDCKWYFLSSDGNVTEYPPDIHRWIECTPDTPRATQDEKPPAAKLKQIEAHITKTEIKKRPDMTMDQVTSGDNTLQLVCWMEIL